MRQAEQSRGVREGLPGAWLKTLKSSWQAALSFDKSKFTPFQATRSLLGMGLPLILGLISGQVETGVLISSGALMLGSVGLKDPYQRRARTMLVASILVCLSALAGGLVGGLGWLPVLLGISLWGLITGLFASISLPAQVVAMQSCATMIVYTHLELDPSHSLLVAGAVGLGALWQYTLAAIPSPWRNTFPERTALASIYQELADAAASPSETQALQVAEALLNGHNTLLSSNTRSERGQMFERLLEEAEHLRLTLFVLRHQQHALDLSEPACQRLSDRLEQLFQCSARALREVAFELRSLTPQAQLERDACRNDMQQLIGQVRELAQELPEHEICQALLANCSALSGELRIVQRLAATWRTARSFSGIRIRLPYPRPRHLHLEDIWSNLRANLTLRSSAFRHAIRLSVALLLATGLYQVFHLSVERGYWIPMTVALVLRADFYTTFTRGIARLLGTALGAVATTLLVIILAPAPALVTALLLLAAYLMYATMLANFTIFSLGTTMAVAFLLSFVNAPTIVTAGERAMDVFIGGVLALLIYAIWPTWEQERVPENIALRLEALGRYFIALMRTYASPDESRLHELEARHRESRLARSNVLNSLQRALQEPVGQRINVELAQGLLVAADNLSRSALTLEAYLRDNPRQEALPAAQDFAQAVADSLNDLAVTIRAGRAPESLARLPEAFQGLKNATRASRQLQPERSQQWTLLLEETKPMVGYLRAMQQLLATSSFQSRPALTQAGGPQEAIQGL